MATRNPVKNRLPLILVSAIFILPVVIAWIWFFSGAASGNKTVNNGTLITPPLQLSQLKLMQANGSPYAAKQLNGKWILMYLSPTPCEKRCQTTLYNMRQIRRATGKEMMRIQRVILTFQDNPPDQTLTQELSNHYPDMVQLMTQKQPFATFINPLPSKKAALTSGYLYLVDPLGNVMMSYDPEAKPKGVLADLQRLLKVSQIG